MFFSALDASKSINQQNWAVTLICSEGGSTPLNRNHAQLVIEGISETQEYFKKIAHLQGISYLQSNGVDQQEGSYCYFGFSRLGRVQILNLTNRDIKFAEKTETWTRSAEKVRKMLLAIEQEQEDPFTNPQAFSLFGCKSIFSSKVDTYRIKDPLLKEIYKFNPHRLTQIFHFYKKWSTEIDDSLKNDGGFAFYLPRTSIFFGKIKSPFLSVPIEIFYIALTFPITIPVLSYADGQSIKFRSEITKFISHIKESCLDPYVNKKN